MKRYKRLFEVKELRIKARDIKGEEFEDIVDEIKNNHKMLAIVKQIAKKKYWSIENAIEEIAYHIRMGDTDFVLEVKESKRLPNRMVKDYEMRAKAERQGGAFIEINERLPYVGVEMSDGSKYFFQGEEASDLLNEVPPNINEEDFILAIAQGW
jgi:hypothetical protein